MALHPIDGSALPTLGLGTWRLGESRRSQAAEVDAVCLALQMGWRAIDTAEMYGEGGAESVVGEALRRCLGPGLARESLFIVSKAYPQHGGGGALREACERSLQRLGIATLDLYLLHWRGSVPLHETVLGMQALQQRGLIRHWGVSNFDVEDLQELFAIDGGDSCAANQIYHSLGQRGAEFALLPYMHQRGQLAMAYSPVDQGALSRHAGLQALAADIGLSAAQVALAWIQQRAAGNTTMAIPKAVRESHLRDNLATAALPLAPATMQRLDVMFPPPRRRVPLAMT